MTIKINMPQVVDDTRINFYSKLLAVSRKFNNFEETIEINWSKTKKISASGYAILCCIVDQFIEQKNLVTNIKFKKDIEQYPVIKLLNKISENKILHNANIIGIENKNLWIRGCNGIIDLSIINNFEKIFKKNLNEDLFFDCKLILNELIQNSITHSGAERYYVYAGFAEQEFIIGVLDMGVSIPAKIEQKYINTNDAEYVKLALKEGTTTRRNKTGGFGLYYTYDLLKQNKGTLVIASRNAEIRRYFKSRKLKINYLKNPLTGTWCFNKFKT